MWGGRWVGKGSRGHDRNKLQYTGTRLVFDREMLRIRFQRLKVRSVNTETSQSSKSSITRLQDGSGGAGKVNVR